MACFLCGQNSGVKPATIKDGLVGMYCTTCGTYDVPEDRDAQKLFEDPQIKPLLYRLSALAKVSSTRFRIDRKRLEDLREGVPRDKTVPEKIELLIRWIASRSKEIGENIETEPSRDYPAAWCRGPREWSALIAHATQIGLIHHVGHTTNGSLISLLVDGWRLMEESGSPHSSKAFIAMAFDHELDDIIAAIHKAIEKAGYDPLRVDDDHYSGGVMDRIITHIRDSKFIVADYTKNRGGVYYEAGVAFGLGIDVINVCNADCLKDGAADRLHFDVRHLVFVPWTKDDLGNFAEDLSAHIIAIHGRGPRATS